MIRRTANIFEHSVFFVLVSTTILFSQEQKTNGLTLENIFTSASFMGTTIKGVQWSPNGKMLTYLKQAPDEQRLSLWSYTLETSEKSKLVDAKDLLREGSRASREENERNERMRNFNTGINSYEWSGDGSRILIPFQGDVYSYNVNDKITEQLTKTEMPEYDPRLSPDGMYVAFVRSGNIFVLSLATKKETQLTFDATQWIRNGESEFIAQEEMDRYTGYWWSPDSKSIAFLQTDNTVVAPFNIPDFLQPNCVGESSRYPKAGSNNALVRVGVTSVENPRTLWFDLGANSDQYVARVNWLPDASRIAVQMQSRNQDTLSLFVYSTTQPKGKLLLQEIEPTWTRLHDNLSFVNNGQQFIWSSERSGFQHLYLYSISGKQIQQITSGKWEVASVQAIDEEQKFIYFTATEKSPAERHLYRTTFDGQKLIRISRTDGWHQCVVSPQFQLVASLHSSITTPPQLRILSPTGDTPILIEENLHPRIAALQLRAPEFLKIRNDEGDEIPVMMMKPAEFQLSKKYPVLMYVYGGPGSQTVVNRWQGNRMLWFHLMTEKGFIVVSADNRGTPGYGKAWLEKIHKRLGDIEIRDQVAIARYLKGQPFVESEKIGMYGWSYGGFLASMALLTTQDIWKASAAIAPVCDWREYDTHYTERYLEHPKTNPANYELSSPISFVKNLSGDLLIMHGMADDNVHFSQTVQFIDALVKEKKLFDVMIFPQKKHTLGGADGQYGVYAKLTKFFEQTLK